MILSLIMVMLVKALREGTSFGVSASEFGINQMQTNQSLPLGSGLLLLAGSGLGYALLKKKEEVK